MLVRLPPVLFSLSSLSVLHILENFTLYLRNSWSLNLRAIENCICGLRSLGGPFYGQCGGGGAAWASFTVNTLRSEVRKSSSLLNYMYLFLPESISKLHATVDIGYHTFGSCYIY